MLGGLAWWIVIPLLRFIGILKSESNEQLAQYIGNYFPTIKDRLLNALQLADIQHHADGLYSSELVDASLAKFTEEIEAVDFTVSVDRSAITHHKKYFIASLFFVLVCIGLFPHSLGGAAYRLAHFTNSFTPPAKYRFEILPGSKEIVKGDNVDVAVKVLSHLPAFASPDQPLVLIRKQQGQDNMDEITVKPDSTGMYRTMFSMIHATTNYYARFGGEESEHYTLTVLDRPILRSFHVRLEYPAYAKLPAKTLDEFVGDITALAGTRVTVSGFASKPLHNAALMMNDSSRHDLSVSGERFSTSFTITKDNA
jgi:hypothetical protein